MYVPNFRGCWAKVRWAKRRRDTLDRYIARTGCVDENRPRIGVRYDRDLQCHAVYVNRMPDLTMFTERSSLLIGDVVHNLRSALDHLAFQLALKATNGSPPNERRIQFPIEDGESTFRERCSAKNRSGYIADLDPGDQTIIGEFQPCDRRYSVYRAGLTVHPLGLLRDLNDTDKHRLLTRTIFAPTNIQKAGMEVGLIMYSHIALSKQAYGGAIFANPVELNANLFWAHMPWAKDVHVEVAGYILPQVALPDGLDPVKAIDWMADTVVQVIRKFDPLA